MGFHGTTRSRGMNIAQNSFQLPAQNGMFGRGLYFASCPLKTIQYARSEMKWLIRPSFVTCCCQIKTRTSELVYYNWDLMHWFQNNDGSDSVDFSAAHSRDFDCVDGVVIMCLVDLGSVWKQRQAHPNLHEFIMNSSFYDSVEALSKDQGGSVRVPEFVVYDPSRIRIVCLLDVAIES